MQLGQVWSVALAVRTMAAGAALGENLFACGGISCRRRGTDESERQDQRHQQGKHRSRPLHKGDAVVERTGGLRRHRASAYNARDLATVSRWIGALPKFASPAS